MRLRSIESLAAESGLMRVLEELTDIMSSYHPARGTVVYFCDGVVMYHNVGPYKRAMANTFAQSRRTGRLRKSLRELAFAMAAFPTIDNRNYFYRNLGEPCENTFRCEVLPGKEKWIIHGKEEADRHDTQGVWQEG